MKMKIPYLRPMGLASLALLGSLLLAQPAKAAVLKLDASADLSLYSGRPNENNGAATSLWVQQSNQTSLIRFDLSEIAIGELTSVTFGIYFEKTAQVTNANMRIFLSTLAPSNRSWVEGTGGYYVSGGLVETGSSTWNSLHHGTDSWADNVPGATATPRTALGSFDITRTTVADASPGYREITITDPTILAQWLESGQVDLLLNGAIASGTGPLRAEFTSREGVITQRPYLSITYEPIPEAGTTALLGIGLIVLLGVCHRARTTGNL